MAQRYLRQEEGDVSFLDYFKVFVGSVAGEPTHCSGGIEDGDASFVEQVNYLLLPESLMLGINQTGSIVKEDKAKDFPHHIGTVRIEKVHAPTRAGRWKTAKHQQPCLRGQEGLERMGLDGVFQDCINLRGGWRHS